MTKVCKDCGKKELHFVEFDNEETEDGKFRNCEIHKCDYCGCLETIPIGISDKPKVEQVFQIGNRLLVIR